MKGSASGPDGPEDVEAAFAEILKKEGFSVKRFNIQIFGNFAKKK